MRCRRRRFGRYTVDGLLNADTPAGVAPCGGVSSGPCTCGGAEKEVSCGCHDGYACAQNIASLLSWLIQTNGSAVAGLGGGLTRHRAFVEWFVSAFRRTEGRDRYQAKEKTDGRDSEVIEREIGKVGRRERERERARERRGGTRRPFLLRYASLLLDVLTAVTIHA